MHLHLPEQDRVAANLSDKLTHHFQWKFDNKMVSGSGRDGFLDFGAGFDSRLSDPTPNHCVNDEDEKA